MSMREEEKERQRLSVAGVFRECTVLALHGVSAGVKNALRLCPPCLSGSFIRCSCPVNEVLWCRGKRCYLIKLLLKISFNLLFRRDEYISKEKKLQ